MTKLDDVISEMEEKGYWVKFFANGQAYAIDPTGWGLQLDGLITNIPDNAP